MIKSSIINRNTGKYIDAYRVGQSFGKYAVEFCNQHNINIGDFYKAIRQEPRKFISGMADGALVEVAITSSRRDGIS